MAAARKTSTPDALSNYLGRIGEVGVLGAEREREKAEKIWAGRDQLWTSLLSHPPFAEAIAGRIELAIEAGCPRDELAAFVHAAHALRQRESRATWQGYETSRDELAAATSLVDLEAHLAMEILEDLEQIEDERHAAVRLNVKRPPIGSSRYRSYVARVRAALQSWRRAKDQFTRANLKLVVSIARRYDHGLLPLADLVQEGNLGLMKAVDRFDPARGFRFSTYATWWIRHAINRAVANRGRTIRLPAHVCADLLRMRHARQRFLADRGRSPSLEELADVSGLTLLRVAKLSSMATEFPLSLDLPAGPAANGAPLVERIPDETQESPSRDLERAQTEASLRSAVATLDELERDIVHARFGLGHDEDFQPLTLRELGERHGLSRERIRQLQERALRKLRRELRDREAL